MKRHIIVTDYNPKWNFYFEELKVYLLNHIDSSLPIVHIGSTSVQGLSAKPIIDLTIIVDSFNQFTLVKDALEKINYIHKGDQGIKDREVFKLTQPNIFYAHHLYVSYRESLSLKNNLTLKKHLENHPEDVKRYSDLKRSLAQKYPHDIDSYIKGKTHFIITILKQYNFTINELEEIIGYN